MNETQIDELVNFIIEKVYVELITPSKLREELKLKLQAKYE